MKLITILALVMVMAIAMLGCAATVKDGAAKFNITGYSKQAEEEVDIDILP